MYRVPSAVFASVFLLVSAAYEANPLCDTFLVTGAELRWPCSSTKSIYAQTGRYCPVNIIATRVQMYKDQAIVVTPRYRPGVPFTVGTMSLKNADKCAPVLSAFPAWNIHEEGNPDAVQNAVDVFLDQQDVLWILDVGIVNTLEQPIRRGPPTIWAVDLKAGQVRLRVAGFKQTQSLFETTQTLLNDWAEQF